MDDVKQHSLREIDPSGLHSLMDSGSVLLVDVREPFEFAAEHIPSARMVPLAELDPARFPSEAGKKTVLYCRSGNRSGQAGLAALQSGVAEVWHLKGGLIAWKEAGLPIEGTGRGPISLDRQVRIASGLLVLISVILGAFISPWSLLLAGLVAAGLVFSGLSNTCGMALLLSKLPYNRCVKK